MIRLCQEVTTPQIFFNEKHIRGGVQELEVLVGEFIDEVLNRFESHIEEIEHKDRLDPESGGAGGGNTGLETMSLDKTETTTSRLVSLPDGSIMSPGQLTRFLLVNTPHKSVTIDNKTEYKFFRGYEGMMIWTNLFGLSTDEDSMAFGAMLQEFGILHNFTPRAEFQNAFLVLQPLKEPHVLNSFLEWRHNDQADPMDVMLNLSRLMDQIAGLPVDDIKDHELYKQFEEAVCQLQVVSVNDIRTGESKVTFGLNLFNLMIRHALIERDYRQLRWPCRFKRELPDFLSGVFYNLGGDCISLRDLQCSLFGVDGSEDTTPMWLQSLLGRRKPSVKTDKRILFALSWGTKMSPEVWTFHPNNLDEELQLAAEDYCQTHIKFDEKHSTVILPKLIKWYRHDFGTRNMRVVEDLVKYLSVPQLTTLVRMSQRGPVKVKFEKYDWTCTLDVESVSRVDGKRERSIRTAASGSAVLEEDERSPNENNPNVPEQALEMPNGSPKVKRSFLPSALVGGRLAFVNKKADEELKRSKWTNSGDYNFSVKPNYDDDASFFQSVVSDVTYGSEFKDIITSGAGENSEY
jgi:hypothetical protein